MQDYKKEIIVVILCMLLCIASFSMVKKVFFSTQRVDTPIKNIISNINNKGYNESNYVQANTIPIINNTTIITSVAETKDVEINKSVEIHNYPYEVAPVFEDDGSLIYDGLTLTELTNKLNKSLPGYMTNTGYFFANYTKNTGLNPYLAVSIVLLETGCKWGCSSLTVNCNNIGGLKGGNSCNGGSYRRYNSLGEGINGFLDIIYKNYYLQGLVTPEQMASRYAQSSTWAEKVNNYINEVKAK